LTRTVSYQFRFLRGVAPGVADGAFPGARRILLRSGNRLTYKAYLDNTKARTGKGSGDFGKLADAKGPVKYGELLKWLKTECGLGHGHANAIILCIQDPEIARRKLAADA
jgi:uncharacterized protein DUF4287